LLVCLPTTEAVFRRFCFLRSMFSFQRTIGVAFFSAARGDLNNIAQPRNTCNPFFIWIF